MRYPIWIIICSMFVSVTDAWAGDFQQNHPRRAEVNQRVRNQNQRIRQGVASGKLTTAQAQQLHSADASVKANERADVKANGGYLTKSEQQGFNQQLNANSKAIYGAKNPAPGGN